MSSSTGSGATGYVGGAVGGAVAWVVGYAVTYAGWSGMVEDAFQTWNFFTDLLGGDPAPAWKGVAWLYFNAHFVTANLSGFPGGSRTFNLIAQSDSGTAPILYVIPPLVLVVVGFAATALANVTGPRESLLTGVSTVGGYLLVSVVMALAAAHSFGADVSIDVTLVTAVVLAGVVYPAVFGGLGGALASVLRS